VSPDSVGGVVYSGSVLGLNPTKASVEGWCALKRKEFALCPSRKTSLSNAIYGNSSEFSDDVITIPSMEAMGPRTCMKTSSALEMQHCWVIKSI